MTDYSAIFVLQHNRLIALETALREEKWLDAEALTMQQLRGDVDLLQWLTCRRAAGWAR